MKHELWAERWVTISQANHLGLIEAAAMLGISRNTIGTYRRRFGTKKDSARADAVRACSEVGMTRAETAAQLRLSVWIVSRIGRNHGLQFRHATSRLTDDRADAMASMYRAGKTLEEIGSLYGLTRERVRQLVKKYHGITAKDGGQASLARARAAERGAKRDARYLKTHGCTYDQYRSALDITRAMIGAGSSRDRTPTTAFHHQKNNAARRSIPWLLTFWQWWTIWRDSGKWERRGRNKDCYVMCRYGDGGSYAIGNVYIATVAHNIQIQPNNPYRKSHPDHASTLQARAA